MGGVAKTVGRVGSGIFTLGGSEIARNNLSKSNIVNKVLQTPGMVLTGGQSGGWSAGGDASDGSGITGPFSLDQAQLAQDQANINAEGQKQFGQSTDFINQDAAARQAARGQLAQSLTQQSENVFKQALPGTEETLNAQHLLNGSGLGQELSRQQGNIATNIADQVGTLGAQDINAQSAQKAAALQGLQGFQTGALQRGTSLEDFINSANVAKAIGATSAPQVPSGKGGALSGGVSGAAAGAPFGPYGAAIGGVGGAFLGSQSNQKGSK